VLECNTEKRDLDFYTATGFGVVSIGTGGGRGVCVVEVVVAVVESFVAETLGAFGWEVDAEVGWTSGTMTGGTGVAAVSFDVVVVAAVVATVVVGVTTVGVAVTEVGGTGTPVAEVGDVARRGVPFGVVGLGNKTFRPRLCRV